MLLSIAVELLVFGLLMAALAVVIVLGIAAMVHGFQTLGGHWRPSTNHNTGRSWSVQLREILDKTWRGKDG